MARFKRSRHMAKRRQRGGRRKRRGPRYKADLIVARFNTSGNFAMSKPCMHCIRALANDPQIQIVHVYYSVPGGFVRVKFSALYEEYLNGEAYVSTGRRR